MSLSHAFTCPAFLYRHQQFHVAFGPCTAICSTPPACRSNNCEFLLPLHAGYDLLLSVWMRCESHPPRVTASPLAPLPPAVVPHRTQRHSVYHACHIHIPLKSSVRLNALVRPRTGILHAAFNPEPSPRTLPLSCCEQALRSRSTVQLNRPAARLRPGRVLALRAATHDRAESLQ